MYGITVEQYDEMREAQKHVCAICSRPETVVMRGKVKPLSVDHDHLTGKVRGLLCHECNVGLGKFKDNPRLLNAARHYIERAY
jgi:ribosomal protein L34E